MFAHAAYRIGRDEGERPALGIAVHMAAAVRLGRLKTDGFTESGGGNLDLTSAVDTHHRDAPIWSARPWGDR